MERHRDPEAPDHVFRFASLAARAGRYKLAKRAYLRYLQQRPSDARAHAQLALCLHEMGEAPAALEYFEQAFSLDPTMASAAANASGLLIQLGDGKRASALCYRALQADQSCSPALYNLNTALRMDGRLQEAVTFSWDWILSRCTTEAHALRPKRSSVPLARLRSCTGAGVERGLDRVTSNTTDCVLGLAQGQSGQSVSNVNYGSELREELMGRWERVEGDSPLSVLTVVCVRWGDKYGTEYVTRLARGVHRNLARKHRFVCFTDDPSALEEAAATAGVDMEARLLGVGGNKAWQGWWHKGFLFSSEIGLCGRIMYLDLDTIIAGGLDEIASYLGKFGVLSVAGMANEHRTQGYNSSVMAWEGGVEEIAWLQEACCFLEVAYEQVHSQGWAC
ncbi:unnamed protein product [Choristocarpus tenellus]